MELFNLRDSAAPGSFQPNTRRKGRRTCTPCSRRTTYSLQESAASGEASMKFRRHRLHLDHDKPVRFEATFPVRRGPPAHLPDRERPARHPRRGRGDHPSGAPGPCGVRGRRHLPGAPGPDPFPETLIEVDGSEGTLRLREGYALTVIGREALRSATWRGPPALGEPRRAGERGRQAAPLDRVPAECRRARDLGRGQPQKPPRSARRPMHRPRPAIRSRRASDGPPIDQPQGGEECRPNR